MLEVCNSWHVSNVPMIMWLSAGQPLPTARQYTQVPPLGHALADWLTDQLPDYVIPIHDKISKDGQFRNIGRPLLIVIEDTSQHYHTILWHEWRKTALLLKKKKIDVGWLDCLRLPHPKMACRQLGFRGYPKMLFYPSGIDSRALNLAGAEAFGGDWFAGELVKWVLPMLKPTKKETPEPERPAKADW
eukprot:TRINITY_DN59559_c0_g1_i2.p1 TRINITY_DN59559_c0_g1~~TRINITY_DN59559_c0_g1_i2.p1  ORF type:complete len:188 (+),score=5.01 TRINITY_DN59559_c0_g1_i2:398-961(+)